MKLTDKIEVLNVDCMEYLATLEDNAFELAIVDPPYGININMNMGRRKGEKKKHDNKDWDKSVPDQLYFDEIRRVSKNQVIWGGNYFDLPLTGAWIYWDKGVPDGVSFADGELAWTSFEWTLKAIKNIYTGFRGLDSGGKIHPTQKPVDLYRRLINVVADQGDRILDTHLGSMSIAIACHMEGFEMVGCELDKDYFDAGVKRFQQQTSQQDIFAQAVGSPAPQQIQIQVD